jgi:hypothetical protein
LMPPNSVAPIPPNFKAISAFEHVHYDESLLRGWRILDVQSSERGIHLENGQAYHLIEGAAY